MQVILLERIGRLGQMGDVVNVKDGYARNFLLPQKKALRATRRQPQALREGPRPARSARPRAEEGGRGGRRQARRQDLPRHPPGRRHRPALRLGHPARHRRAGDGGRLLRRPPPDRARPAHQDAGLQPTRVALHPEVIVQVIAQHRPLRGRGRAPGPRRGRDGRQGGGRAARDLQSRRRVRGGGPGAPARRGGAARGAGEGIALRSAALRQFDRRLETIRPPIAYSARFVSCCGKRRSNLAGSIGVALSYNEPSKTCVRRAEGTGAAIAAGVASCSGCSTSSCAASSAAASLTFIDAGGCRASLWRRPRPLRSWSQIADKRLERHLVLDPQLALGEGYMQGRLKMIEGRIYDFLELLLSNIQHQPEPALDQGPGASPAT